MGIGRRGLLQSGVAVAAAGALPMPAIAEGAPLKFKFGNDLPMDHSVNIRLKEAVQAVEQETKGQVAINVFPNNQLGSDTDMIQQLRSGALEMATMPSTLLSTLVPISSITGLGFVFDGYEKVWAAMDGDLGAHIRKAIEKVNLVPFEAAWDNGFREITTSTKPIVHPDDLRNFKIRVPVVPLWVQMFTAFGASPTSIPLSEAYAALQTKIADGQENSLALIETSKFYEVQKYCSLTNHAWDPFWGLASGRFWRGVPADVQQVIAKHLNAAAKKQREDMARDSQTAQKSLEGKGLVFNTTDPKEFRNALNKTSFYGDAKAKFGDEAWNILQKYTGPIGT